MSNFTVKKINPFVGSKDFAESKEFYCAIGWKLVQDTPDLAELQLGESCIYLQRYYQRKWCENTMLHITVDDAAAWYERVKSVLEVKKYGAAKVEPPREQDYGAIVTFVWDPVGVLLHFAQPIEKI